MSAILVPFSVEQFRHLVAKQVSHSDDDRDKYPEGDCENQETSWKSQIYMLRLK